MAHTRNERAPFGHSEHTGQHHASHNSHDEEVYNLKRKVNRLCRCLHRRTRIKEERTPTPSQSFSSGEKHHHKRFRTPPRRSMGNDAMGKTFLQISRSPFIRCIEQSELPRRFNQPTFTIYNGKTDPIKHMSHFNQRMTIHSKNKALMCKVFPQVSALLP